MQTSELNAYPKVGLYTGSLVVVDALAVWVLLIYLSQTAITFTKKVKVIVGSIHKNLAPTFTERSRVNRSQNIQQLVRSCFLITLEL